jgi:hypothetical protein
VDETSAVDPAAVPLPARFHVGANIRRWRGGGQLIISPRTIVLEPGPLLHRMTGVPRVVHTDRTVRMIRTRLFPPWINTSLVLQGEGGWGIASTWFGARRRWRQALSAAGFTVEERSTWFSMGTREARR